MSRSNASVIRNIRENENLQVRKTILKASGSAARLEKIARSVLSAGDIYLDRIAALDKFKKATKLKIKLQTHRMDWFQEAEHLSNLASKTEDGIGELLQAVVVASPHEVFAAALFQDILSESSNDRHRRELFQRNAFSQIQDVKALLRDQKKKKGEMAALVTDSCADGGVEAAVFADIFLKLRNSLNDHWLEIQAQEKIQSKEVGVARRQIAQASAQYNADVAERSQLEQLRTSEDDPLEVKLLQHEWQKRLRDFDSRMETSLKNAWQEWTSLCETEFLCDPASINGAWSEDDHTTFSKIFLQFKNTDMSRHRMIQQLTTELSHKTHLELSKHEDWYVKFKAYHKRHKDIISAHNLTERQALLQKGKFELDQCRAKCAEVEAIEIEMAEREALRQRLHSTLMEQRRHRDSLEEEKREAKLVLLRDVDTEMRDVEEQRQAAKLKEIERKKAILKDYKQQRMLDEEEQRKAKLDEEERLKELRKQRIETDRVNIEHRNALVLRKLAEKKRKEEEFLHREERLTELLLQLATKVPYYEKIKNVESKLDHITASARAQEYQGSEEGCRGHLAINGFTDKAIFKDARFRLGLALRAAGVHQSEAARETIAALHPRAQAPF